MTMTNEEFEKEMLEIEKLKVVRTIVLLQQ